MRKAFLTATLLTSLLFLNSCGEENEPEWSPAKTPVNSFIANYSMSEISFCVNDNLIDDVKRAEIRIDKKSEQEIGLGLSAFAYDGDHTYNQIALLNIYEPIPITGAPYDIQIDYTTICNLHSQILPSVNVTNIPVRIKGWMKSNAFTRTSFPRPTFQGELELTIQNESDILRIIITALHN